MLTTTNALGPLLTKGGLSLHVNAGSVFVNGAATAIAATDVTLTASATNYVYVDLATGALAVSQSAFPAFSMPIATATTGTSSVRALTDNRPDFALFNSGSTLTGNTSLGATTKLSQTLIRGRLKLDERPTGGTAEDYALQIRSESGKASGTHWGVDAETHLKASGTATLRGTCGVAVLDATFTSTGGDLHGLYGQARADGTYNNASGFVTGVYGLIEASAALTASHVASIWADSHQANAVTGHHELIYASNNGAAELDAVLYTSGQSAALIEMNTAGGPSLNYITGGTAADGTPIKIKVVHQGTAYYLNAYPTNHP